MAQSVAKGTGGNFATSASGVGFRINEHVCRITHDINDASGFDAFEQNEVGQGHIEWGANGVITLGTTADQPTDSGDFGTATLTYAVGCTVEFTARLGTEELMMSVRDNGRVRLQGRGSGDPDITWATGT